MTKDGSMTKDGLSIFRRPSAGFSLLELVVVVLIMMVIGVIALPNMVNVVSNARLRGGATNLSGLLQNARMVAIKENKTKEIRFTTMINGAVAYVKDASDTAGIVRTDPQVQMGTPLTKMLPPLGTGAPPELTSTELGFTALTTYASFTPSGLPCTYSGGNCTNAGFVFYFKDRRPLGASGWASVSVSPAGRLKRWFWNGSAWGD
jgi:type II secretory pathway pseudopilin PulG